MKAAAVTLRTLLQGTDRYEIPLYQRPYVWESRPGEPESDRLGPFWEDVKETTDAYLERARLVRQVGGDEEKVAPMTPHFFGAVVIDLPSKSGEVTTQEVIDGQQRLTTTLLLLAAATRLSEQRGMHMPATRLRRLWKQDDELELRGLAQFKLTPTRQDQAAFLAVMDDAEASRVEGHNITRAYDFFVEQLESWVDEAPEGSERELFDALRVTLYEHLMFADIRLEAGDNAQGIFESLNAQGEKLLAMDLVKNEVFRRAKRFTIDLDALDRDEWSRRFADPWWRGQVRQGRYFRPAAELFLMHWLIDQHGRDISATALYVEFQALARTEMESVDATNTFVRRFLADADRYRALQDLPHNTAERRFLDRLKRLDITVMYPVVLRLWRWKDEGRITREGMLTAFAALESYLFRRFVVVPNAGKNYNYIVIGLLRALGTALEPVQDPIAALVSYLRASDDKTRMWPSDDVFIAKLSTQSFYRSYTNRRDLFLLEVIERRMTSASRKTEQIEVPAGLTIEHVVPQSWQEHWPLPETGDEEASERASRARQERIHRLGNLSLVTKNLNPAMGKDPWESKREQLLKFSNLQLNADLVTNPLYAAGFDEDSIDERGDRLARLLVDEWPGPWHDAWPATK
ncbi:DUF262 domain-containing protein [Agrococcus sp. TSP3-2-1]|uniref:DUF262 domain-containing protein n=1 Tax=Agrococcus sp. TSP3-2-1 TaxID=2804583 RepID=UPI003CEA61E3